MESEARCDKPRVGGGSDVLLDFAASSRVETKCIYGLHPFCKKKIIGCVYLSGLIVSQ